MNSKAYYSFSRRLVITTVASGFLGLGAIAFEAQAAPNIAQTSMESPLILAETDGMERRDERGDDRKEDRDVKQDCRDEEGVVGDDKRDCKKEGGSDAGGAAEVQAE